VRRSHDGGPSPNDGITAAGIERGYIKVLVSTSFRGAGPSPRRGEKTTAFLVAEFRKLGLKPGPDGISRSKKLLVEITGRLRPPFRAGGGCSRCATKPTVAFTEQGKAERVALEQFAAGLPATGAVAPEYGWDDHAVGLDVKGKTVVVLVNDPVTRAMTPPVHGPLRSTTAA
jgi:hypothetical protein